MGPGCVLRGFWWDGSAEKLEAIHGAFIWEFRVAGDWEILLTPATAMRQWDRRGSGLLAGVLAKNLVVMSRFVLHDDSRRAIKGHQRRAKRGHHDAV